MMQTRKRVLPPSLAQLPTVAAELKYDLGPGKTAPSLEGPTFDAQGNFYCCKTAPDDTTAVRIDANGTISEFCHFDKGMVIGLAFHDDGRCFATDMRRGSIRQLSPEGEILSEVLLKDEHGESLCCNSIVFDDDGSMLLTDMRGSLYDQRGGIWKLLPDDDYGTATRFFGGMACPNGIGLKKRPSSGPVWDSDALFVIETATNALVRMSLDANHAVISNHYSPARIYRNPGKPNLDSLRIDEAGNIYMSVMFGGRAVICNPDGLPIANVVVPGFEDWKLQYTSNLALHPFKDEVYMVASDQERAVVLSFPTLA